MTPHERELAVASILDINIGQYEDFIHGLSEDKMRSIPEATAQAIADLYVSLRDRHPGVYKQTLARCTDQMLTDIIEWVTEV